MNIQLIPPSPWAIGIDLSDIQVQVIAANGSHICYVECDPVEEIALLIAVAPEMLLLLKRLNEAFYVKGTRKALMEVMKETKPLIARAEGR